LSTQNGCELDLATNIAAQLSLNKFPDVQFLTQKLNLPAAGIVKPNIQGPRILTQMPAQSATYAQFNITYLLRADFSNHATLVNWLTDSLKSNVSDSFFDGSVFILGAQRTQLAEVKFYDMQLVSVSEVEWDTTIQNVQYKTATAVFDYLYYKFV
jgi:hypothetical protein